MLKMFIDVIIKEGKSTMSSFYINPSSVLLIQRGLLLASLLTYSIFTLFMRCSSDLSTHPVSAVSICASKAQMLENPQLTQKNPRKLSD